MEVEFTTHALCRLGPLVCPAAHPPARRGRRSRGRPPPLVEEELVRPRRRRRARLEGTAESETPKIEVSQPCPNYKLPRGTDVLLAPDLGYSNLYALMQHLCTGFPLERRRCYQRRGLTRRRPRPSCPASAPSSGGWLAERG